MTIYTVHLRSHGLDPDRDLRLIKEGISWPALLFGVLWALWNRLWLAAAALVAVQVAVNGILPAMGVGGTAGLAINAAIALTLGLIGNDLIRRRADRDGFEDLGVVLGDGRWSAEARFLDARPDVARALRA